MKLSFSTLACPTWSLPQIVGAAAAYGIHGVDLRGLGAEIDITRLALFNSEINSTLELLRRHAVRLPCLHTSVSLVTPAPERWEMMLAECQRYARLAGQCGSLYLRVFGGAVPRGMKRREAVSLARRHLRQLVKVCAPHRCVVLVETHDEWSTSAQMMELLNGFALEEAGALWDVEHPFRRGEAARDTAAGLGRYARHIHFKDAVQRGASSIPRLLGEGDLPLREFVSAIRESGYDGWICLESEKRWHPQEAPEPEESLPQFVRWMKENW